MFNNAETVERIKAALVAGKIVMVNRRQYEGAKFAECFYVTAGGEPMVKAGSKGASIRFANISYFIRKTA